MDDHFFLYWSDLNAEKKIRLFLGSSIVVQFGRNPVLCVVYVSGVGHVSVSLSARKVLASRLGSRNILVSSRRSVQARCDS